MYVIWLLVPDSVHLVCLSDASTIHSRGGKHYTGQETSRTLSGEQVAAPNRLY